MELSEIINGIAQRGFWFNVGHIVVIVATIVLGILAYKRNPRNLNNKAFFVINISASIWSLIMYLGDFYFLASQEILIARATYGMGFILAIAYFRFCLIFPEQNLERPFYYRLLLIASIVFTALIISTDWMVGGVSISKANKFSVITHNGFLFEYSFIMYAILAFGASAILFSKLRKLTGKKRVQVQYVFLATFTFVLYIFTTDLIPQLLGYKDWSRYGALGVIFFILFVGYAVLRHRLLDIRLLALKSFAYSLTVGLIAGIYILVTYIGINSLSKVIHPTILNLVTLFVLLFSFQPLRVFLEKKINKYFAKGYYNFEDLLKKISSILSTSPTIRSLSKRLTNALMKEMKIRKAAFIFNESLKLESGFSFNNKQRKELLEFFQLKTALVADELEDDSKKKQFMRELGVEVLLYFSDEGKKKRGCLALSEKASGDGYTSRDLRLLEIIAPQISTAIINLEQQQKIINQIIEERQRIDQDAHDHIYNRLGALAKKAEAASLNTKENSEAKQTLDLLKTDLRRSVDDLQRIVQGGIEESSNTGEIVSNEVKKICSDFVSQSNIKLSKTIDESFASKIKPQALWHFQCILEECLNNIQKHSKATEADVSITSDNGSIVLRVQDNGIGIKQNGDGKGLKGMKERADKIGAKINFGSNGKGTEVKLKIKN